MKYGKWLLILLVFLFCTSLLIGTGSRDEKKRTTVCIDLSGLEELEIRLEGLGERIEKEVASALKGLDLQVKIDGLIEDIQPLVHMELGKLGRITENAVRIANVECMRALEQVEDILANMDWEDMVIDFDWDEDWDEDDWD